MAYQDITIGTADAGGGETPFSAWTKAKAMFLELYQSFLDALSVITTGGTITLNLGSKSQRVFYGATAFGGPKIIALSNATNGLVFVLHISVTTSTVLTITGFTMDNGEARWDAGADQLTLTGTGKYKLVGTKDPSDGTWKLEASKNGGFS